MVPVYLCLLDCSSIQRYVFGSNKLKANLGASGLVEEIYRAWIPETLAEMFEPRGASFAFELWKKQPEILALAQNEALLMETGYLGGGNALLLFRAGARENPAETFIKNWSGKLLQHAPGLRPSAAWVRTDLDNLAAGIDAVFAALQKNKNALVPNTTICRHGLTANCRLTGLSAEVQHPFEAGQWISAEASAKLQQAKAASAALAAKYQPVLQGQYQFGEEIENLGQAPTAENHVAIVHIDGNGLGAQFMNCASLAEMRQLSLGVESATEYAMRVTLQRLIDKMGELNEGVLQWPVQEKAGPAPLPLRPIILNGDDVTFVCDARLGLFLAETFMQAFAEKPVIIKKSTAAPTAAATATEKVIKLSSCAGVAVIKTKYPFYRGYTLAAELCRRAKQNARRDPDSSWLDFHIAYRGLSGPLADLRKQLYRIGNDSLLWRPWKISAEAGMESFHELKKAVKALTDPANPQQAWPRSKRKQLAQALTAGETRTKEFLDWMKARGLTLPRMAQTAAHGSGWQMRELKCTPYFDILEAAEFYPKCLLE